MKSILFLGTFSLLMTVGCTPLRETKHDILLVPVPSTTLDIDKKDDVDPVLCRKSQTEVQEVLIYKDRMVQRHTVEIVTPLNGEQFLKQQGLNGDNADGQQEDNSSEPDNSGGNDNGEEQPKTHPKDGSGKILDTLPHKKSFEL